MRAWCAGYLLIFTALAPPCSGQSSEAQVLETYRRLFARVDQGRIEATYRTIAANGSRLAGSVGERRTLEFAEREFRRLGLKNIRREYFDVSIPDPDATGTLTIGSRSIELLPLWPNLVRTSTAAVKGRLIYGADGSLKALKGKDIQGSIVLLEFNSLSNWRNAAKLGAAAILFVEPDETSRGEAEQKFAAVPLSIPRFYLSRSQAGEALEAARREQSAELRCRQDWIRRRTYNLLGELPGSDPSAGAEPVAIFGYVDAMSVVPGIAPGAESSGSLATLLETVAIFAQTPHRRPITFVATSAHYLALQGTREYVDRRMRAKTPLFLGITLDIDSGNSGLAAYGRGWFYEYRDESQQPLQPLARVLRQHADRVARAAGSESGRHILIDALNQSDNRTWKNNMPAKFALDCEPLVQAGYRAISFVTTESARELTDTPFDTIDKVNFANVKRQVQTIAAMLHHLLNDQTGSASSSPFKVPSEVTTPQPMSLTGGFATVEGKVAIYDPRISFVPDVSVPESIVVNTNWQKSLMGVRGDMVQLATGPKAAFRFLGLAPTSSYRYNEPRTTMLAAFKLDPESGNIVYAPSLGVMGAESYPFIFEVRQAYKSTPIIVFPSRSMDLYDMVDPQEMQVFYDGQVLDAKTNAPPREYGFQWSLWDLRQNSEPETGLVLFGAPGERIKLLMGSEFGETRLILTNADAANPEGRGILISGDGTTPNVALQSARDFYTVNASRLKRFDRYRIVSQGVKDLHSQSGEALKAAELALQKRDWPALERDARAAWSLALRVHPILQGTANDVISGVLFYLFLLIPFSYFVERLAVGAGSLTKQLVWSSAIFMATFLLIRLIHPAFEIVTNPAMIFVGFVMGSLSLLVITFILGKFETSLKAVRQQQSGIREVDIGRASVAMAAFNLGVGNMRRRKARTLLTTLTLVVMTFIVLSFTSIVPELQLNESPSDTPARYAGLLLRMPGLEPLQNPSYRLLANEFGDDAAVARRAWYYGADIGDNSVLSLQLGERSVEARALMGMEAQETRISRPQETLLPGSRWFTDSDDRVVILPQEMAGKLGISKEEFGKATVRYAGQDFTVIGVFDPIRWRSIMDLDGDMLLPADFSLSRRIQTETNTGNEAFRKFIRLDPATVFLVPARAALRLGADIRSVAVGLRDGQAARTALESLMPRLRLNLYGSVAASGGLEVRQFSILQGSKTSGLGLILIQILIAAVFVLNTMIASVYERTKEIAIFSAIGLAPNHISMLFFAESLVYGVLGSVIGYISAQILAKLIVATDALPGLYLNFSSMSAVFAAALVMGIVLLSTIYPARIAARIAAPALNEEAFRTEPDGDNWRILLPFNVSANEAAPLVEFFGEWFRGYEGYAIGNFVTADTRIYSSDEERYVAETNAWPAPYDLGVSQRVVLQAFPSSIEGVCGLELILTRLSGERDNWMRVNKRFLGSIRKQFLTWRTLEPDQRAAFVERSRQSFAMVEA
ncbi:MAG: FtsX-like permease family protein [Fimbriimonadaceae bacterium]